MPILLTLFQKTEMEGILLNSYTRSASSDIKTKISHTKENYRPKSLMNINAEILNEILAKRIQQYVKRVIYHDQVGFIPGRQ